MGLEQLLITLGLNISASTIYDGIKNMFESKRDVTESDYKNKIKEIVPTAVENDVEQIYNNLVDTGNITIGENNTVIGSSNITNGSGNTVIGGNNKVHGSGSIAIGHGNKIG